MPCYHGFHFMNFGFTHVIHSKHKPYDNILDLNKIGIKVLPFEMFWLGNLFILDDECLYNIIILHAYIGYNTQNFFVSLDFTCNIISYLHERIHGIVHFIMLKTTK